MEEHEPATGQEDLDAYRFILSAGLMSRRVVRKRKLL